MAEKRKVRVVRQYSEALKQQVVEEISQGKVTVEEAKRRYGIPSHKTINRWRKARGKMEVVTKLVRVVMKSEKDRIRELEEALADEKLKNRLYNYQLDYLMEEHGEEFKKKLNSEQLKELERLEKQRKSV